MSVHYVLDGYNIIHCSEMLADRSLSEARTALIQLIRQRRLQGSGRNTITVVFDGRPDVWGDAHTGPERILFSSGETADDMIKRMVEKAPRPQTMVIVTNDGEIAYYVRRLGAQVVGVAEFLKDAGAVKKRRTGVKNLKAADSSKHITPGMEHHINTELTDIWLHRKKKN